ncbi:MAG: chorismate mutase [Clostridiales bacterium]|nr:chorismate mutase [Clostridiales bacterium]
MELEQYREELNRLDNQITELFVKRLEVAERIAWFKAARNMEVYQPEREKAVLARLRERVPPRHQGRLEALYGRIFEISRGVQEEILRQR